MNLLFLTESGTAICSESSLLLKSGITDETQSINGVFDHLLIGLLNTSQNNLLPFTQKDPQDAKKIAKIQGSKDSSDSPQSLDRVFEHLLPGLLNTSQNNLLPFTRQEDIPGHEENTNSQYGKVSSDSPLPFNESSPPLFQKAVTGICPDLIPKVFGINLPVELRKDDGSKISNSIVSSFLDKYASLIPSETQEVGIDLCRDNNQFLINQLDKPDVFSHLPKEGRIDKTMPLKDALVLENFIRSRMPSGKINTTSANINVDADTGLPQNPVTMASENAQITSAIENNPSEFLLTPLWKSGTEGYLKEELGGFERSFSEKKQSEGSSLNEAITKPDGTFPSIDNITDPGSLKGVQHVKESPEITSLLKDTMVITRKDDTSIEVSLKPEGIGKLDIRLSLDRGMITARIDASETIGKDMIERNLESILNTLANEGLNIGSFSVHLRDKRKELLEMEKDLKDFRTTKEIHLPIVYENSGMISIFV